jgi:hypothetical protein
VLQELITTWMLMNSTGKNFFIKLIRQNEFKHERCWQLPKEIYCEYERKVYCWQASFSIVIIYLSVTSNLVRAIHCLDKWRGGRVCTVGYDVYSNLPFSKCIVSLMCTLFSIRVHEFKVYWTEHRTNNISIVNQSWPLTSDTYHSAYLVRFSSPEY